MAEGRGPDGTGARELLVSLLRLRGACYYSRIKRLVVPLENGSSKSALRPVPWKTSDVAIGIVITVAALFLVLVIYGVVNPDVGAGMALVIVGGATGVVMIFTSWVTGPARYGASLASLGLRLPVFRSHSQLLLPPLVLVISVIFAIVYVTLVSLVDRDGLLPAPLDEDIVLGGPAIIGSFALAALWGPLAEEIFFRGFVFSGLAGRLGIGWAAAVSSLLFALAHFDPRVMVPIFAIGLLLAWLYTRTGSIWACFATHAAWNALALSISVWA